MAAATTLISGLQLYFSVACSRLRGRLSPAKSTLQLQRHHHPVLPGSSWILRPARELIFGTKRHTLPRNISQKPWERVSRSLTTTTIKPESPAVAGPPAQHGWTWMATDSLIWSCCAISNGILTTSGVGNTKRDIGRTAIQIGSS